MSTRLFSANTSTAYGLPWYILLGLTLLAIFAVHFLLSRRRLIKLRLHSIWYRLKRAMPASGFLGLRTSGVDVQRIRAKEGQQETDMDSVGDNSPLLNTVLSLGRTATSAISGRKALPDAPKGLGNWDNSCYQNSVLQALAALPSLQNCFARLEHAFGAPPADTTLAALQALGEKLNDMSSQSAYHWTPPKLKSMSSWQQQDAQEYFSKLVEAIEKDVKSQMKNADSEKEALSSGSLSDVLKGSESLFSVAAKDSVEDKSAIHKSGDSVSAPDTVTNPLDGLLAQRVGCTACGYTEGLSLIPFNCMTLPLGKLSTYNLEQCLDEYSELEYIDGVECPKCTLLQAEIGLDSLWQRLKEDQVKEGHEPRPELEKAEMRLRTVKQALEDEDFAESTLTEKCGIPSRVRKTSRKSRQAVVVRGPRCLVLHINRSMFDEYTGNQFKNYAVVRFPKSLDLSPWTIGASEDSISKVGDVEGHEWKMDPSQSLIMASGDRDAPRPGPFSLKAVITHYGRHENGHYVCYRQSPKHDSVNHAEESGESDPKATTSSRETWWRLSDEDVSPVTEANVLAQEGVFMLFYERSDPATAVDPSTDDVVEIVQADDEGPLATVPPTPSLTADSSQSEDGLVSETHELDSEGISSLLHQRTPQMEHLNDDSFDTEAMETFSPPSDDKKAFSSPAMVATT